MRKHTRTLRRISPLHRLFQVSLGVVAGQRPEVVEACGRPVQWMGTYGKQPGIAWSGPKGVFHVVPTLDGAWAIGRSAPEVVRAVDDVVDAMLATAETALGAAKPGKEGNVIARQWFYLQEALTEPEFVRQYVTFVSAPVKPEPLTDLFGRVAD